MIDEPLTPQAARASSSPGIRESAGLIALPLCLLFFLEGLLFIPYVGIQSDEVLFTGGIYPPWDVLPVVRLLGHTFPLMLISYIGTLKAWIYRLFIFPFWPPSPWSVRIPVLLLGALTLWLFFEFARRTCGARTAIAAAALLATDATFVLTTCFDWGPVALQHFLLMAGVLSLWMFHRSGNRLLLAAGFVMLGLGLWDKAVFSWPLAGLAAACLVAFPRELIRKLTPRNLALAAAGFALGAAPFLIYTGQSGGETFQANARFSTARFGHKVEVLRNTFDGSALFGYIVRDEPALQPNRPQNALERLSVELSEISDHRRSGVLALAFVLAFALLPWLWNTPARTPMLFSLTFMLVTWLQMALTSKGGVGAHHIVLLWPFPHLFVAAALSQASRYLRRAGLAAVVVVVAAVSGANLVVLNEYFTELIERGTSIVWSDAVYPLSGYLSGTSANYVYVMDWGIYDSLRALGRGRLPLELGADRFLLETAHTIRPEALGAPDAVCVGHTEASEVQTGNRAALEAVARSAGLQKHVMQVISDRNKRPIFEVYRFDRN
jgi:4-amino-4-deoxy-L-arabinose transferase-like glycosyltransferase